MTRQQRRRQATRAATLSALVITLVLGYGAEGCERRSQTGGSGGAAKACDTSIGRRWPRPEHIKGTDIVYMRAETKSECDATPGAHVVQATFTLLGRDGDSWTTEPCRELPAPGRRVTCQFNYAGICLPGEWQVSVLVTGSMQGRDFTFQLPEKPKRRIRACPTP